MVLYILDTVLYAVIMMLVSFGLNLSYGVTRFLNISHGGFITIGSYVGAFIIVNYADQLGIFAVALAVTLAALATIFFTAVLEPPVFHPAYRLREEHQLILTFGLLLILEDFVRMLWGSSPIPAREPFILLGNITILSTSYPLYNIVIITTGLVTGAVLWILIYATRWGKVLRAVSSDIELATAFGVNTRKIFRQALLLSTALAGFAGAMTTPITTATPGIGLEMLLLSFLVIVIGGLGSIKGTYVGSLLTSMIRTTAVVLLPRVELVILYAVASIILIARPRGLV